MITRFEGCQKGFKENGGRQLLDEIIRFNALLSLVSQLQLGRISKEELQGHANSTASPDRLLQDITPSIRRTFAISVRSPVAQQVA